MNHAHSDLVEVYLELGIPGVLLLLVFLAWWLRQTIQIWSQHERPDYFARAATIATAAILVHSLVDYPLRTASIASIFAVLMAIMAGARPRFTAARPGTGSWSEGRRAVHLAPD